MGIFDFFKKSKDYDINVDPVNYWIKFIEDEVNANGKIKNPYLNLIQHQTNFFKNDRLVFSGCEMIIEVFENEEDDAEILFNVYPELICGDASIIKENIENTEYNTHIIENLPEYDNSELGNGQSSITSGDIEEIAISLVDLEKFNYKDLLPLDKLDFTYFDYFSKESHLNISTFFLLDETFVKLKTDLIGAEVYAYNDIMSIDNKIKRVLNYDDIILLLSYKNETFYKDITDEKLEKKIISNSIYELSDEENKLLENISKKHKVDIAILKWVYDKKNLKFPLQKTFLKDFSSEIKELNKLLTLFKKNNSPAYNIILSELFKYKICIWKIYSEVINNDPHENIIQEMTTFKYPRAETKIIGSQNDYEKYIEKEPEEDFPLYIKEKELEKESYINLEKEYFSIIENSQNLKVKERLDKIKSNIHLDNGSSFYNDGNIDSALNEFEESLNLNPSNDIALYNRSLCHFDLNKMSHALADLSKAIEINKNEANYYYMRGLVLSNLDEKKSAAENYSKCIDNDNNYKSAYLNRGTIRYENNDYEGAISDFDNVIRIEENNFKGYLGRGLAYKSLAADEAALDDFIKVIELNPDYAIAYKYCYEIYHWYDNKTKAKYHAEKYLELEPNDVDFKKLIKKTLS